MITKRFALSTTTLLMALTLSAQTYVTTTGADVFGGGGPANPFRTISFAVSQALPGHTVFIASGTYNEVSEVYINQALTLVKNGTGPVIIDAFNRDTVTPSKYMMGVVSTSNVVVDGIRFQNCIGNGVKAIYLLGSGNNITIRNCSFDNIGWTSNNLSRLPPNNGTVANAIRVEANTATPFTNISILHNDIANCATGWGEALTLTGNVDGFTIRGNAIHHTANIGIVAAGNYPTGAPAGVNQARNGSISGNEVYNCMSGIAPSAGIYIDGAVNCTVEGNTLYQNGVGISVGGEQAIGAGAQPIAGHRIRNNLVYENVIAGIFLGTNNASNPIQNTAVYNNTFYKNRTGAVVNGITTVSGDPLAVAANDFGGELLLQNINGCDLQNNIVHPLNAKRALVALSGYTVAGFTANYNVYYREDSAPLFELTGTNFNGSPLTGAFATIAAFTAATGLENNSVFGSPGFNNAAFYNFTPAAGAFCIDKGNPVYTAALSGLTDIAGNTRIYNGIRTDAGAYEYQGGVIPAVTYMFTGNGFWNVPGNWAANAVPPAILTPGSTININPLTGGECVLNISQTLMPGASLNVLNTKKLRVPGRLVMR